MSPPQVSWIMNIRKVLGNNQRINPSPEKGVFWSVKICTVLPPDLHFMAFVKIRVPNQGIKPYFPLGGMDCNEHISIDRPRSSEYSGTRVLGFPL